MAPPPYLVQFLGVLLFLSIQLVAVSGIHRGARQLQLSDNGGGEHQAGIICARQHVPLPRP